LIAWRSGATTAAGGIAMRLSEGELDQFRFDGVLVGPNLLTEKPANIRKDKREV
jgi:hypothetical protein